MSGIGCDVNRERAIELFTSARYHHNATPDVTAKADTFLRQLGQYYQPRR
jgi:hypothetical protein